MKEPMMPRCVIPTGLFSVLCCSHFKPFIPFLQRSWNASEESIAKLLHGLACLSTSVLSRSVVMTVFLASCVIAHVEIDMWCSTLSVEEY